MFALIDIIALLSPDTFYLTLIADILQAIELTSAIRKDYKEIKKEALYVRGKYSLY